MQLCEKHFAGLSTALDARGLTHLIPPEDEILKQVALVEAGEAGIETLKNPLGGAIWGIFINAVRSGGLYLLGKKPDGSEFCPLCELEHYTATAAQDWIDAAANDELNAAKKNGTISATVN